MDLRYSLCLLLNIIVLCAVSGNKIKKMTVKESNSVVLSCTTSHPGQDHSWYKMIPSGSGFMPRQIAYTEPRVTKMKGGLFFTHVELDDAGIYKCAVNDKSSILFLSEIELIITPNSDQNAGKPHLQKSSPDTTVLQGKQLVLFCIFSGRPLPNVEWTKQGKPMTQGVETVNIKNTLTLSRVTPLDAGLYRCKGRNKAGEAEGVVRVTVLPISTSTISHSSTSEEHITAGPTQQKTPEDDRHRGAAITSGAATHRLKEMVLFLPFLLSVHLCLRTDRCT